MNVKYNSVRLRFLFLSHVFRWRIRCAFSPLFVYLFGLYFFSLPPRLRSRTYITTTGHCSTPLYVTHALIATLIWCLTINFCVFYNKNYINLDYYVSWPTNFMPLRAFFLPLLNVLLGLFTFLSIGVRLRFWCVSSTLFVRLFFFSAMNTYTCLPFFTSHSSICVSFFFFNSLMFVMFPFNWLNACGSTIYPATASFRLTCYDYTHTIHMYTA